MVTHVLIRLAELREEAAAEEWQQAHPRLTACLRRLRYLRIRGVLAWRRLAATDAFKNLEARMARWRAALGMGWLMMCAFPTLPLSSLSYPRTHR